jgi:uncharacterized membrane protein YhaH (DUF805 family)
MFQSPFSFDGRIARAEYAISVLVSFLCIGLINLVIIPYSKMDVFLFGYIPVYWFMFAQGSKRAHDIGQSGWWQFFPLFWLLLLIREGDSGTNKYGV